MRNPIRRSILAMALAAAPLGVQAVDPSKTCDQNEGAGNICFDPDGAGTEETGIAISSFIWDPSSMIITGINDILTDTDTDADIGRPATAYLHARLREVSSVGDDVTPDGLNTNYEITLTAALNLVTTGFTISTGLDQWTAQVALDVGNEGWFELYHDACDHGTGGDECNSSDITGSGFDDGTLIARTVLNSLGVSDFSSDVGMTRSGNPFPTPTTELVVGDWGSIETYDNPFAHFGQLINPADTATVRTSSSAFQDVSNIPEGAFACSLSNSDDCLDGQHFNRTQAFDSWTFLSEIDALFQGHGIVPSYCFDGQPGPADDTCDGSPANDDIVVWTGSAAPRIGTLNGDASDGAGGDDLLLAVASLSTPVSGTVGPQQEVTVPAPAPALALLLGTLLLRSYRRKQ